MPKAYRPIALLNTIGKIMDSIIARRLSFVAETYHTLPASHFGGRKQKSTEHALHHIVENIYAAWNTGRGRVASLLLLVVSEAFDSVSHDRLLHDLRKRRVDGKTVRCLASFLSERHTRIVLDGHESDQYTIRAGIPQGSPLSPILYILYSADLIENCHADDTTATGYIDDAAILAVGDSTKDTCEKLAIAVGKAQHWATTRASKFAPEKFQLVHFTRARKNMDMEQRLETPWCSIAPSPTCKYLGVTMDSKLKWQTHIESIQRKVTRTVSALASLGNSKWGVKLQQMRKLYEGVTIPQMMYACSVWSYARSNGTPYTQAALRVLQGLQARAARVISGAFRATSYAALDIETQLLLVAQRIERCSKETLSRMLTTGGTTIGRDCNRRPRRQYSPLQINHQSAVQQGLVTPIERPEDIPAFVMPPWQQGPQIHIETAAMARPRHASVATAADHICIYIDGSCINGHVGATAMFPAKQRVAQSYIGLETTSTVYAAELQGINLALQIAEEEL